MLNFLLFPESVVSECHASLLNSERDLRWLVEIKALPLGIIELARIGPRPPKSRPPARLFADCFICEQSALSTESSIYEYTILLTTGQRRYLLLQGSYLLRQGGDLLLAIAVALHLCFQAPRLQSAPCVDRRAGGRFKHLEHLGIGKVGRGGTRGLVLTPSEPAPCIPCAASDPALALCPAALRVAVIRSHADIPQKFPENF